MLLSVEPSLPGIRTTCLQAESIFSNWNIPQETVSDLVLSIDEALTNILMHGYKDIPEHIGKSIAMELSKDKDTVRVIIRDNGRKFLIDQAPGLVPSVHIKSGAIGGLGVYLIKKLMDQVKSYHLESQNILWMSKSIVIPKAVPDFITTPTADGHVEKDILVIRTTPGAVIELEDAVDHMNRYFTMIHHHPHKKARGMLIDTRGMTMISREARTFYTDYPQSGIEAIAILIDSVFTRWIANLFISLNKDPIAIQMFNSETEARLWLSKYLTVSPEPADLRAQ